ncbi:MAG: hypothetical protein EOO41_00105 [Methanobacteriota archaeon]|nr:MAG: hypothetical protein EOO41_00105 [Euryarchaeota archaeon]
MYPLASTFARTPIARGGAHAAVAQRRGAACTGGATSTSAMALCRWLLWVALPACAGAFFQEKIVPPPSLAASLAALAAHPAAVPVHIDIRQDADLRDATVTMCTLPWAAHAAQPHLYPMNRDLVTAARCFGAHSSDAAFTVTFAALEEEFFSRSCPVNGVYTDAYPGTTGCVPTGMIFHEARCGSTLAANMLASLPHTIVYSEALVPMIVAGTEHLVVEDRVRALRVMTAAMGRPAAAAAGGQPLHAAAAADDARAGTSGGPATAWQPYHVYFKFQSTMAVQLRILRLAFPDTPWLFLYRQPEEVLVSLLRMATTLPPPDAPASQFIPADDRGIRDAPCMRQRGAGAHPFIQAVVRAHSQDGAMLDVSAEAFCAISVAHLATAALHEANMARVAALQALRVQAAADNVLEAEHLLRVLPADVLAQLRSGVAGGIGQGLFVQYDKSPAHLIEAIRRHIPPRSVRIMRESTAVLVSPTLTDAEVETMAATARMYSKLRGPKAIVAAADAAAASGRAGLVRGLLRPLPASRNEAGHFLGDTKEKQQRAWAACRLAASTYLQPIHDAIRAWMLPLDASTVSGDSSSRPVEASSAPAAANVEQAWVPYGAAARRLAIGNGYPQHYPLQEILREWNPDIVSIPKSAGRYQSLRIFDFAVRWLQ